MNRRDFCKSAVCAAVVAALPAQPVYMTMTHDGTNFNVKSTGSMVMNTTTNKLVIAQGSASTAVWRNTNGELEHMCRSVV